MWNNRNGWGWPARALHWGTGAIILYQLGLGVYMTNFPVDLFEKYTAYQTHKSWGFAIFAFTALRLGWRAANRTVPADAEGAPAWERAAARATHLALYLLMIALPLSGWLAASASPLQETMGVENSVFGWFSMPDPFVPGSKSLEADFSLAHEIAAILLGGLLVVHVGAALKHHFINRDSILRRMVRGR